MGKNTFKKIVLLAVLLVSAQNIFSQAWNLAWREDFGVAEDTVLKDFPNTSLTMPHHSFAKYQSVAHYNSMGQIDYHEAGEDQGVCGKIEDGQYAITNNVRWAYQRFASCGSNDDGHFVAGKDHTGNKNGAMLVVNTEVGEGSVIYKQDIDFNLCSAQKYKFVIYAASVTTYGEDGDGKSADFELIVINKATGDTIDKVRTGQLPYWKFNGYGDNPGTGQRGDVTAEREWQEFETKPFLVNDGDQIELQVTNWGSGFNDYALDDVSLYRYDDVEIVDPTISTNTISSASTASAGSCIYSAAFNVPEDVLTTWKGIYQNVYFLWQKSEDDGYTWENVDDVSGIDKINVDIEVDKNTPAVFRVIITGASTVALAKERAEYIAKTGGPEDGCSYYSISNTLAGVSPTPDCSYKEDARLIWSEDFGVIDSTLTRTYDGCPLTYYEVNKDGFAKGNYVVCAAPDTAIKKAEYSWDGSLTGYSYNQKDIRDASGKANGAMLYTYFGKAAGDDASDMIFNKAISGPFCSCKNLVWSFVFYDQNEWAGESLKLQVVDDKGTVLGEGSVSIGHDNSRAWNRVTVPFDVPNGYTGSVHLQIINTTPSNDWNYIAFDDFTVAICGESAPKGTIQIDDAPGASYLGGLDCSAVPAPTISVSDAAGWAKAYPKYGMAWQQSADGGETWTYVSADKVLSYSNDEGGLLQFRAVFAETAEAAVQAAKNGKPDDPCIVFGFSNIVGLECSAQCHFNNDMLVLWKDDFGSVPAGTRKSCKNLQGHTLLTKMSESVNDGYYAVVSRMKDAGTWFAAMDGTDHTGNADGGFLLINVDPDYKGKVIYEQELGFTTCPETSYFFSLWAASISKRVATGASDGVLCNLRLEIIDKATNTVLASKETGNIPNAESLSGTIPWINYGTSFTSSGESVILRIYDNAGNGKKGNDLVIDDISLIACEEAAPVVELAVDGEDDVTGVCNESEYTLAVGDLTGWNKIYGDDVYCLWQQSADGGETWKTLEDNSGNASEYGNLKVTALRNMQTVEDSLVNVGYRYRVIVAGPKSEVTEQISKNGYPDNGCYLFRISNIMTVRCDCKEPEFKASTDTLFNICQSEDAVTMSVKQTNTATLDTVRWFSKKPADADWTKEDEFIGEKIDATSLTKEVVPTDSIQYLILGYSEACVSDSVVFTINVDKPIEIEDLASTTLCAGSDTTYKAVVTSGYPLTYVWNGTEGKSDEYAITGITKDVDITLVAKGSVCESEEKTATVTAEAAVEIADKLEGAEVCAFTETSFDSKAVATNIQWYQSYSGSTVFTPIASATEAVLTCSPDSNRTYKVVASGDKCPSKELSVDVTVTYPSVIEASIDKTEFCVGESATISVTLDHVTTLEWLKQEEGETSFSKYQTKTYSETETSTSETVSPSKTTKYLVQVPSNGCAAAQSEPMTVTVENPIEFTLSTSDTLICKGTEITLTSALSSGNPASTSLTATTADGATELTMTDGKLTLAPEKTTTYTMTMKGNLCASEVSHDTTVKVEIPVAFGELSATESICEAGDPGLTISSVEPSDAPYHYMTSADGTNFTKVENVENPTATTWYKVVSDAGNVCEASETNVVKVSVEDSVRYTLTVDKDAVCEGEQVTFTYKNISGAVSSAVLSGATDINLTDGSYPVDPVSMTYKAVVKGGVCPEVTKEIPIDVQTPASLSIVADNETVCINTPVNITLTAENAKSTQWWSSTNGRTFTELTTDGTGLIPLTDTWYKVSAVGAEACPGSESNIVKVTVEDSIRFSFTADKTVICAGDEVTFSYKYISGLISTAVANDVATIEGEGTFTDKPSASGPYKIVFNGFVCPSLEKSINIEVQQPATLAISTPATSICVNTPVDITLTAENADATQWWSSTNGTSFTKIETDGTGLLPQTNTWYKVSAIGAEACPSSESNIVAIAVEDSIRFSVTEPASLICKGTSVKSEIKLTSGTPSSTVWKKNGTSLATANAFTDEPIVAANTYEAVVTGTVCPAVSKSFDVTVEMPATINKFAASSNMICENGEVELTIDQVNANGLVWEKRVGNGNFETISEELTTSVTDEPTDKAFYRVRSTGSEICSEAVSSVVTVDVEDSVKVTLPEDYYVCPGNQVTLTAEVAGTPTSIDWTKNGTALSSHAATQSYKPTETATFHVTANAEQCPDAEAEMTVYLEEIPELVVEASNDSLCEGDEVQLTATFVNDTSIVWYAGSEMLTRGTASLSEVPTATTSYMATAATEHGCPVSSSKVKVNVSAKIEASTADTFVCAGETVPVKVTSAGGYKYSWYNDEAHTQLESSTAKFNVTPEETTTYYLVIANGSCSKELTSTVEVKEHPSITDVAELDTRMMQIVAEGGNGTYEYNYGKGWSSDDVIADIHFGRTYTLQVRDAYGCIGDSIYTTPTYDIKIPTYFTPNGDGISDNFSVVNLDKYPNSTISIYDRFGKLLVKISGADFQGWDGTYNGHVMPSTDYWYEINIEELDKVYTGHFTLLH